MYCVNCGVKLADSEKQCPLCGVVAFHPDIDRPQGRPLYPAESATAPQVSSRAAVIILSTLFLIPIIITFLCDFRLNRAVTWSGYVMGALTLAYILVVLPLWFRRPNPVIFVPCDFVAIGLYVLYIDLATSGRWFLSFAFPVIGTLGLIVTAVITLLKYLRGGRLYIFGGACIALGLFMPLMEFLMIHTFHLPGFAAWSLYPLVALVLLGGMLLTLAIHRPSREAMSRKFFI